MNNIEEPLPLLIHKPIAADQLKNHATEQRVDAVWLRLQAGLVPSVIGQSPRDVILSGRWHRPVRVWGIAALAFGGGILVGAAWFAPGRQSGVGDMTLHAEPLFNAGAHSVPGAAPAAAQPDPALALARQTGDGTRGRSKRSILGVDQGAPPLEPSAAVTELLPTVAAPQWQLLAQQGEYEAALSQLESSGGYDSAIAVATADQLMLLVDVARATGFRQRAVQALRQVITQHGSDPLAPLAAWSLGNMLDKSGDREGAADAFAAYRALSPQGDFAEDALAREIRVAAERGDAPLVKRLAAQYEQAFPNGRRAAEIREQRAALSASGNDGWGSGVDAGARAPSETEPPESPATLLEAPGEN